MCYLAEDGVMFVKRMSIYHLSNLSRHRWDFTRSNISQELEGSPHLSAGHHMVHIVFLEHLVDRSRQEDVYYLQ